VVARGIPVWVFILLARQLWLGRPPGRATFVFLVTAWLLTPAFLAVGRVVAGAAARPHGTADP
jgi:hypothetical protein